MKNALKSSLLAYGLKNNEVAVFLATLDVGEGSAGDIAKHARLNRVTVYEILKRLVSKGFVGTRIKPNTSSKIFFPKDLEEIRAIFEGRRQSLSNLSKDLEGMASWYTGKLKFASKGTRVHYMEGKRGLERALMKGLEYSPNEILTIASMDETMDAFDQSFLDTYWKKRTSMGIRTRGFLKDTKRFREYFNEERNKRELREVRFVKGEEMSMFADLIDVSNKYVAIFSLETGKEGVVIIESERLATSWKALFEMLWKRI